MSENNISPTTPTLDPSTETYPQINGNDDDIVITDKDKEEFINKMVQYRNTAITFIGNNKKELASIYLQHINSPDIPDEDRCGVLGINLVEIEEKNNVDVAFIPTKLLHIELVNQINERKKENDENIIYFLLLTPVEEKILEIDIRTLMS